MKRKLFSALWVVGVLTLAVFCLPACHRELDVEQSYDFTLTAMPVEKDLIRGDIAEIRCSLKAEGNFKDTKYTIRYFQPDGRGELRMNNGTRLRPNDRYPLGEKEFRLYYTSESDERQTIDVYVEDNFGHLKTLSFSFNAKRKEKTEELPPSPKPKAHP